MNLAELGIILASRSLPLAVVSSGDWLRPAATRPRRSHSLVFVGSRWSLAAQRSGDGSGERKAEFISPGGMPSRPGGSGRRHRIPKLIKGLVLVVGADDRSRAQAEGRSRARGGLDVPRH